MPEAVETEMRAEAIALTVVYEDDDLAVIDKPPGLVVHPAPGTPTGTLVNALLHHFGDDLSGVGGEKRPGVVHRIDKDTSGLLVVAKSDAAHHGLAAQFEAHEAERLYLARVPRRAGPGRSAAARDQGRERGAGRDHQDHDAAGPAPDGPAAAGGGVPGRAARGDAGGGGGGLRGSGGAAANAGSRRGGRTRSGCTWRMSGMG